MASYSQFFSKSEVKRTTWLCGSERVLVEELVDFVRASVSPASQDYASFTAGSDSDKDIYAHLNQYPTMPGDNHLTVVRSAQRVKRWRPLLEWLEQRRLMPTSYVLLVSDEPDFNTERETHAAIVSAGSMVKCSYPNDDDLYAWVCRQCELPRSMSDHLVDRVGGDLAQVKFTCQKLSLFSEVSVSLIDHLAIGSASRDFADELIATRKPSALSSLSQLPPSEWGRTIGLIDSRLDVMVKLHGAVKAGLSTRDIVTSRGVPAFLVRKLIGSAKHYDSNRVWRCRQLLALVDDAVRSGARDGPLEALVAMW